MTSEEKPQPTHLDEHGQARMVDVGDKQPTRRSAVAEGYIRMRPETLDAVRGNQVEKGDVLTVAQIAGIAAGKRTAEWIPLCHPLPLDVIDVELTLDEQIPGVRATARAQVTARTGVEMEALVAVSAALLTVYDMCKSLDRSMSLNDVQLLAKRGGRSGTWTRDSG